MSLVFAFSGTSEGRELCEKLSENGIRCRVFVATEYGEAVMREHENITVNVGRLELEDILHLIEKEAPDYIIDATHPHAELITENIKAACKRAECFEKYIRVSRNAGSMKNAENEYNDTIIRVASVEEAVEALNEFCDGNIMLTCGVKELHHFCTEEYRDRIVARILPSRESLDMAYALSLSTKQVIAMEGPFSVGMNESLIENYNISVMVTKNSGSRGGYKEKIEACAKRGIKAIVIEKEEAEIGHSIGDVLDILGIKKKRTITFIGAGVCNRDYLLPCALHEIQKAELIIGAKRMVSFGREINPKAEVVCEYSALKVTEAIERSDAYRIAVIFSGDTGLCSGAKNVISEVKKSFRDADIKVIPGISSVSYFASKLMLQYSDYGFISLHDSERDFSKYLENGNGFFAICKGKEDIENVYEAISTDSGYASELSLMIGKDLGSEKEEIIKIECMNDAYDLNDGLYVIAAVRTKGLKLD